MKLDLRLVNADVLTLDTDRPSAREIGVWQGRVLGLDEEIADLPAREVVDLRGATVLPGFIDAHVHLAWAGLKACTVSIAACESLAEALAVIRDAPGTDWVDIAGYDQRPYGRHLTAAELDSVSGGRRVIVSHNSGHACVVNSAVLAQLPQGTSHEDGLLAESGMAAVRELRQPYSISELVDAIEHAARTCRSEGVTACAEAGIGGGLITHSPVELAAYQAALAADRLPVRVQLMVAGNALHPVAAHVTDDIPRALDLGLRTGFGGDRLSIGALKIFTDGGMMARTAALTEPYVGLDHSGQFYDEPELLRQVVLDGHRAGWQLAIHAIGDRAVDLALDSLEQAQRICPRPLARHRIEHAGLVRDDQLARFASVGAAAVVQPNFLWYLGDDYAAIMGESRAPWLYRGRGFLDHGVPLVGSSDRPVTIGAPLRAIQFMVERRTERGLKVGPSEGIGVLEALRAYTVNAAHACNWERSLGSIAPGKHADFAVLAEDPRVVEASRIGDIEVLRTYVAGQENQ
ncbi:amidohydrolase [Kutzneria viridogrisea]|uniref:Amidohydrolase 3 domain-containing protein n=1 Tax=Kutzneria viridogrisea TaxID=47990 RepID=A0ABR6BLG0_9PSEU|nr:hypothetical protein [Kutzneria viridogrisea]